MTGPADRDEQQDEENKEGDEDIDEDKKSEVEVPSETEGSCDEEQEEPEESPPGPGPGHGIRDPIERLLCELQLRWQETQGEYVDVATGKGVADFSLLNLREPYFRDRCKWHDACQLVLPAGRDTLSKLMASLRWVAAGRRLATQEEHETEARQLKTRFGIQPRPRAQGR